MRDLDFDSLSHRSFSLNSYHTCRLHRTGRKSCLGQRELSPVGRGSKALVLGAARLPTLLLLTFIIFRLVFPLAKQLSSHSPGWEGKPMVRS